VFEGDKLVKLEYDVKLVKSDVARALKNRLPWKRRKSMNLRRRFGRKSLQYSNT
jgi:hypothetical protein